MREVYGDKSKLTDYLVTRYHKMGLRVVNRQAFIDRAKIDFKLVAKANVDKLKSIETSTLLVWGAKDTKIPLDNGKRMDRILSNSKLVVLENSGHLPVEENPEESFPVLNLFLND